jgi:hypothetical protein
MTPLFNDDDLDEIFDWLQEYVKEDDLTQTTVQAPSLKPEQRELLWQAAQAHQAFLLEQPPSAAKPKPNIVDSALGALRDLGKGIAETLTFREPIPLAFAAAARQKGLPPTKLMNGDCTLTVEYIPDDPDQKIVVVQFAEQRIAEFQGRVISIGIGGKEYSLGKVSRRGIAEGEIPGHLDLAQMEYIDYGKPLDSGT